MSEPIWEHSLFGSGSQSVSKRIRKLGDPFYSIGHAADDTPGHTLRTEVGRDLAAWLNGGDEPWWMDHLCRKAPNIVTTPHGCDITATGPMIDRSTPPAWGDWWQDESDDAKIIRGRMADALMEKKRPDEAARG